MSRAEALSAGAEAGPTAGRRSRRGAWALAAAPLLAALTALFASFLTGFDGRSPMPPDLAARFYGFFLDRYPLFAFALVYGLAHILASAAVPGAASPARRAVLAGLGVVLLLAAGLYPTFGGLVLRGAFATGGMAFLTHQPLWLAYGLGTAVGALMFGGVLGLFAIAANRPLRPRLRRIVYGALAFLALWFGAILIGLAGDLGVGPWPRRAMRPEEAALAAGLLVAAALPHAALATLLRHRPAL